MRSWKLLLPLLASTLCFAAQPDRITGIIDSSQMVALPRSVNPKAQLRFDQGPVESSLQFGYVTLVVAPSPSQQMGLEQLLGQQQDRSSPNYHKWLTPEQYAARFGMNQNDVNKITAWLQSEGFTILSVPRGRNEVIFSGTASQIQSAFKTEIHRYDINGEIHVANSTAISVPVSLNGVVTSIRGIADFRPKPMYVRPVFNGKAHGPHPSYTTTVNGNTDYFLAPGDIATLYDLNPLYNASPTAINGAGEKLAIIGQTDVYLADLADFRTGFGLNPIAGCTTNANGVVTACDSTSTNYFQYVLVPGIIDPGTPSTCGDIFESDLDIEWSGAVAQNAQIVFVNAPATFNSDCTEYTNNGGVNVALDYAIQNATAPVVSMSYGSCEDGNDSMEPELQQANTEGMTIMNSAGDTGSAGCDNGPPNNAVNPPFAAAEYGLAVNYPASSPEVTGVGGTSIPAADFTSTYWNTNGSGTVDYGGSALTTLIGQEAAWNDDEVFAQLCLGEPSNSFCINGGPPAVSGWVDITSAEAAQEDLWISAGGGGVSNCFDYNATTGVCTSGFPKPSWQSVITMPGLTSPQSTYRFVPDVSLLASPNYPGYILCTPVEELSSTSPYDTETTSSCANGIAVAADGTLSGGNFVIDPSIVGGTSVSSPVFAGIITLMNQYLASSGLGNINPQLYYLAENPSNGAFHQVTSGDNSVYCQQGTPAGYPADVICPSAGVIGFSASTVDSTGGTGYNLVAGLGSVDANELASAWTESLVVTTTSVLSSTSATSQGSPVTFTATVTPSSATGVVNFYDNSSTTALGSGTLSAGTASFTTTSLPGGSNSVVGSYVGINGGSTSPAVTVSVTPSDFTLQTTSPLAPASISAGQSAIATLTLTLVQGTSETINFTNSSGSPTSSTPGSCTSGLPAGALCSFQNLSNPSTPTSVTLNSGSPPVTMQVTITTAANMALPTGAQTITITGTPSGNGTTSHTASVSLTVTATKEAFTIAPANQTYSVNAGGSASVNITVSNATGGTPSFINSSTNPPTTALPLTYTCAQSSLPSEASCSFNPTSGNSVSATSVTLNITTTAPTGELRPPLGHGSPIFYALLLPGLFGMVFLGGSRTRGARLLSLIVVLGFSTLWLSDCGGSSNSSQKNPGTPAGSYSIVVNATTATPTGGTALTGTFTVTLAVTN